MTGKIPKAVGAILAVVAIVALSASVASAATIYNNIPKPMPKNTASIGFEATSTAELGGAVGFAGTVRNNPAVSIVLSSWACQEGSGTGCKTTGGATFNWPVTVKVYNVGPEGAVGSLITESTKTLAIPYRPSANNKTCTPNGEGAVGWGPECFHGKEHKFTYPLTGMVPNEAIISVSYNTTNYGASPVGPAACSKFTPSRCAYDSLNVGLEEETGATTGTQPRPADAYVNSTWAGFYCDGGAGGTGTFRLDAGCWTGFQPLLAVKASK
jgi:hypothetical protein